MNPTVSTVSAENTFFCGGKVNLFLKTECLNPDGFHSIATLFLPFDAPADRLEVEFDADEGISLYCDHPEVPCGEKNIVWKAAKSYADAAKITPHWSVFLHKDLPMAAGVGGGSSDAGAMLTALEKKYGALGREKLAGVALSLGADVPLFLIRKPCIGRGRGEKLSVIDDLPMPPVVLVNPAFPVSAKWAYTHLSDERRAPAENGVIARLVAALKEKNYPEAAPLLHNDLEYALFDKFPLLGALREELLQQGALRVIVSGSGSSLLALMRDHSQAETCATFFDRKEGLRAWHLKEMKR